MTTPHPSSQLPEEVKRAIREVLETMSNAIGSDDARYCASVVDVAFNRVCTAPTPYLAPRPPAPRDAEWAKAVSEIKELALAIRNNLHEDAAPTIQEDKWVITAAAHALCILDNVEVLARHAPADSASAQLAAMREELKQTRLNLQDGLDRDRDETTTPHLATVMANALAGAREQLAKAERERDHWKWSTETWNVMAVELGKLAGVADNEVPWFDKAKAAISAMQYRHGIITEMAANELALRESLAAAQSEVGRLKALVALDEEMLASHESTFAALRRERDEAVSNLSIASANSRRNGEAAEKFLADLTAANAELAQTTTELEKTQYDLRVEQDECRKFHAELVEARKDSAMLDWEDQENNEWRTDLLEPGKSLRSELTKAYDAALNHKSP